MILFLCIILKQRLVRAIVYVSYFKDNASSDKKKVKQDDKPYFSRKIYVHLCTYMCTRINILFSLQKTLLILMKPKTCPQGFLSLYYHYCFRVAQNRLLRTLLRALDKPPSGTMVAVTNQMQRNDVKHIGKVLLSSSHSRECFDKCVFRYLMPVNRIIGLYCYLSCLFVCPFAITF